MYKPKFILPAHSYITCSIIIQWWVMTTRSRRTLTVGYLTSSGTVYLANPYQLENVLVRIMTSLGWPLTATFSASVYYLNRSWPSHFILSTFLPITVFSAVIALAFVWWIDSRPPVTSINRILKLRTNRILLDPSDTDWTNRELIIPYMKQINALTMSPELSFRAEHSQDIECVICRHTIEHESDVINCPTCNSIFHCNHFLEWIKIKGSCPICRTKVVFGGN